MYEFNAENDELEYLEMIRRKLKNREYFMGYGLQPTISYFFTKPIKL